MNWLVMGGVGLALFAILPDRQSRTEVGSNIIFIVIAAVLLGLASG